MKLPAPLLAIALALATASSCLWADATADVIALRNEWDRVMFTMAKDDQVKPLETLISKASALTQATPAHAPTLIWAGIIHSSYAGAKGGLGALGECKTAKALLERAIAADPTALHGAAWTSLGSLYYQVPGWPLGFGDDEKAEQLLKKGLEAGPQDLDAHYFYADFLMTQKRWQEAAALLQRGLATPADAQRPLFQQARRQEMTRMLAIANGKS